MAIVRRYGVSVFQIPMDVFVLEEMDLKHESNSRDFHYYDGWLPPYILGD
jgi:hypothetical protein